MSDSSTIQTLTKVAAQSTSQMVQKSVQVVESKPWPLHQRIVDRVHLEPVVVLLGLALMSWLFYKVALKNLTRNRHTRLQNLFRNLSIHVFVALGVFGLFNLGETLFADPLFLAKFQTYVGFVAVLLGLNIFLKICRIFAFETLFFNNMRAGVPLLLVNLITFILSIVLLSWFTSKILNFSLEPLLVTSAFLSVVLGLALQDTIGNLFSGVALQFDKPFDLGDWIEVQSGDHRKWIGQVHEVSWRATTLISFLEEVQIIPNKTLSNALITNYSGKIRPVIRTHVFPMAYGVDIPKAKKVILSGLEGIGGIKTEPAPIVLVLDANDNWLLSKLIYFVEDIGTQFLIADRIIAGVMARLEAEGLAIASPRLALKPPQNPSL